MEFYDGDLFLFMFDDGHVEKWVRMDMSWTCKDVPDQVGSDQEIRAIIQNNIEGWGKWIAVLRNETKLDSPI